MRLIALDDEPLVLKDLEKVLCEAEPDCELSCFALPEKALEHVKSHPVDVAFLDIEMGNVNGILFARKLKAVQRDIHIIFVTSHENYAVDAFALHATGYLMKPVMPEDIRRELTFIYGEPDHGERVRIQTFGGFCVYVDESPLEFRRAKSKELLACLVDRRGMGITTREACSLLWEEEPYDTSKKNYFQMILCGLRSDLRRAGIPEILVKRWNSLAVDPSRFECDFYQFLEGNPRAINHYRHDYMPSYSWGEFTMGLLEEQLYLMK